jgi:quercetin dioxygenase-like cupin family protein
VESKIVRYMDTIAQELGEGVTRRVLAYQPGEMMVEVRFAPGARGALHSHPHTQCTYVLQGKFLFSAGAETFIVHPGDTLAFAPNETHGCVCESGGVLLDVFAPMREEFLL